MKKIATLVYLVTYVVFDKFLIGTMAQEGPTCKDESVGTCTDLYEDTADMLKVAMHTYGYSSMRKVANKFSDMFENVQLINNTEMTPIDSTQIVSYARENKDALLRLNETNPSEFTLECSGSLLNLWNERKTHWQDGEVTVAIDTDNSDDELVYGIAIDNRKKRVIVSFRGSVTLHDWLRNIGMNDKRVNNPHYQENGKQPKYIRLHTSWHDYLLKKPWFSNRRVKYDMIKEELEKLLLENTGYSLFVTGHSLGGALSTIFSFYIASETSLKIPKPVTLISFASPLVGDKQWQIAYQQLEKDGTVRHLRVAVEEDYVPTVPISAPINWFREYKHTGINLKLIENQPPILKHSYGMMTRATNETKWAWDTLPWHTLTMYDYRLDQVKNDLQGKQLQDLYQDVEVLGNFSTFT